MLFENFTRDPESNSTIEGIRSLIENYTDVMKPSEEAKKVTNILFPDKDKLLTTLSPEQKSLFDRIEESDIEYTAVLIRESYTIGFKTAMRLAFESFR